ncbi:MAG: hypothetical protein DMG92_16855 [Acidobacteria bacterium]|nr:MAG: hypothetical protein DMG92_16855 [Acidobacteriota bacterium]
MLLPPAMNENGTVTRAWWESWPLAAIAVSNSAKPAKFLICLVISAFSFVIRGVQQPVEHCGVCATNSLSGAAEESVMFSKQNLVQGKSWRK